MRTVALLGVLLLLPAACRSPEPPPPKIVIPTASLHPTNEALLEYLGEPVPWPSDVEAAFTAEGHRAAFAAACEGVGAELLRFETDASEFPLVVGVDVVYRDGSQHAGTVGGALPSPYEWSGGTSSAWDEDGRRLGRIVSCVVPLDVVAPDHWNAVLRRRGVRVDRLYQAMRDD